MAGLSNEALIRKRMMAALHKNQATYCEEHADVPVERAKRDWASKALGSNDDALIEMFSAQVSNQCYNTKSLEYMVHVAFNLGMIDDGSSADSISRS